MNKYRKQLRHHSRWYRPGSNTLSQLSSFLKPLSNAPATCPTPDSQTALKRDMEYGREHQSLQSWNQERSPHLPWACLQPRPWCSPQPALALGSLLCQRARSSAGSLSQDTLDLSLTPPEPRAWNSGWLQRRRSINIRCVNAGTGDCVSEAC